MGERGGKGAPAGRAGLTLAVCAALGAGGAGATTVITGNMNLEPVPATASLPCLTFQGAGSGPARAAVPAPVSPEMADAQKELAGLEDELKTLTPGSAEYTQLKQALDMARAAMGAAAPRPAAPVGKGVAYRQLTAGQAVGNLYVSLAYRVSPRAWQAFLNTPTLSDPDRARAVATAGVLRGRPLAGVAAYLKVLEKHPKNADALYNLGALAAFLNAPNEALALLAASEANGGPKADFYPPRAQLLSTRGYALMQVGRAADAEKVLRQAVTLAPTLVEANRNLAAALGSQGKCAEAKAVFARALRRTASVTPAGAATPGVIATPAGVALPPVEKGTETDRPALVRDLLDFSRGKVGRWPYFPMTVEPEEEGKLDRMIAEYRAWVEAHGTTEKDFRANHDATLDANYYSVTLVNRPLLHARYFLLLDAVRQYYFYPRAQNLAASLKQGQAQQKYLQGEANEAANLARKLQNSRDIRKDAEAACKSARDVVYCTQKAEYEDMTRQCTAVRTWNNVWRGALPSLETPTRAEVAETDRYFTTVVSYTSDPRLLRYQRAHLNLLRKTKMSVVPAAIAQHLEQLREHKEPCVFLKNTPPPTPSEALGAYEDAPDSPCQPKASLKAKALIFEVSVNCEKVAFEVGVEVPWLDVGVFVNVEEKLSAGRQAPPTPKDRFLAGQGLVNPERIPQFGDPPPGAKISTFGAGAGVKAAVGAAGNEVETKAGFYVTGDGKGSVADVGAKVDTSATAGGELDIGIGEIGVGVEFEGPGASVSFMPSAGDP